MGVYYLWVCKVRKEYLDPGNIPNEPEEGEGYSVKYASIPYSAWAVAVLALDRWARADIRLISDAEDEQYEEVRKSYLDVSSIALREGLLADLVPEEALRFLIVRAGLLSHAEDGNVTQDEMRKALLKQFCG